MSHAGLRCLAAIFFLMLMLTASPAVSSEQTGIVDQVLADFKPQSGVVVMPVGDEFLIDLDASHGLVEGDIVTVIRPGEKIVHPTSGKVLGSLDEVKGILQVTEVKSGYSHARPVGTVEGVTRGDSIRRYENLSAALWDYTGEGEVLYSELKSTLPGLKWQSYAKAQTVKPPSPEPSATGGVQLIFVLQRNSLEVRGPSFELLHSYPLPASAPAVSPVSAKPEVAVNVPGIVSREAVTAQQPTAIVRKEVQSRAGIWYSSDLQGAIVSMAVGDFDGDKQRELAIAFADRLEIARLQGSEYVKLTAVEVGAGVKILSLDEVDLDRDGKEELYVTAARDGGLVSRVVTFADGRFIMAGEAVPWYFRAVALPGEGKVLLAQRMGESNRDFDGPIFRVVYSSGRLSEGAPLPLPWQVSLYGFLPFTAEGGEVHYAYLSINDYLQVLNTAGEQLWESSDYFGGSESYFERADISSRSWSGESRRVYIQARLERGSADEILVTANKGSRLMASSRKFTEGRVVAFKWDGHALQEVWHTQSQKGYLADFRLADVDNDGQNEMAMAIGSSKGGFGRKANGRSNLTVIEMQ